MDTRTIKIQPLAGMDTRWNPPQNSASYIQDMTWDQRGAWVDAGGFESIVPDSASGGGLGGGGDPSGDHDPTFPSGGSGGAGGHNPNDN